MLIIDGDYPMAYGAIDLNRDLTQPIQQVRSAEAGVKGELGWPDEETMASLPEMRRGHIAAALVKVVGRIERPGSPIWGYRSPQAAFAAAQAHLAYYRILDSQGEARILRTREDFNEHLRTWLQERDHSRLPVGFVLGMEGADPILSPEHAQDWWEQGLRVVSLSHYGVSTYCHGTGTGQDGGLLPPAADLLKEIESIGMILDLTHASDESAREALRLFSGAVLASHQNCRALVPGERQFPDDLLKAIIDRAGVIGMSMDSWMLYKPGVDWSNIPPRRSVFPREAITLTHLAEHVDYVCQLAGNSLHAAIGGDTDGQGGRGGAPLEIDTVADYQKLADVLERRGYSRDDISNIMFRNWQRFFEASLPAR